jgi:hypothetical protein
MNVLQITRTLMTFAAVLAITSQSHAMLDTAETQLDTDKPHLPPRGPGLRPLPVPPLEGLGTLQDLSTDARNLCLSQLTLLDKVPLFCVSKAMNSICKDEQTFYQTKLLTLFRKERMEYPGTKECLYLSALQVLVSTEAKVTPGETHEYLTKIGYRTFLTRTSWKPADPCFTFFHPQSYVDCSWGTLGYTILLQSQGGGSYPKQEQSGYSVSLEIFKGCEKFENVTPYGKTDYREAMRAEQQRIEDLGNSEETAAEAKRESLTLFGGRAFDIIPYTKDLECQFNSSK